MATKNNIPFEATHPGILIRDELEVRDDINQKDLAKEMGVKASFLNEIIKGKRPITADYAIILEKILGIPADYWMRFQSQYEIDKARIKEKHIKRIKSIKVWETIKAYVPVKYFKKFKYLTDTIEDDIQVIMNIYNVSTIEDLVGSAEKTQSAFYKKSDKLQIDEKNMLAWSSIATHEARQQKVNKFYSENIEQLCIQLNEVFFNNKNTLENTERVLNQFGIKFITIPKLEKTPIDGYSFWSGDNPSIALTLRHNRIDDFAFTVMHEVGHIALHLFNNRDAEFIDFYRDSHKDIAEKEADDFAKAKLISTKIWNEIIEKHTPLNEDKIIELSSSFSINPAILLGRVCYETNDYAFKTKISRSLH